MAAQRDEGSSFNTKPDMALKWSHLTGLVNRKSHNNEGTEGNT